MHSKRVRPVHSKIETSSVFDKSDEFAPQTTTTISEIDSEFIDRTAGGRGEGEMKNVENRFYDSLIERTRPRYKLYKKKKRDRCIPKKKWDLCILKVKIMHSKSETSSVFKSDDEFAVKTTISETDKFVDRKGEGRGWRNKKCRKSKEKNQTNAFQKWY